MNKAYDSYRENSIISSRPEELTLLLFNGLIKFILRAQLAVEKKDIEKAHNNIIKAQDIILEFQLTLNMDYDISHNLMLLYDYMYRRLVEANVRKDRDILEEVLGFARELRDTWATAMKIKKDLPPDSEEAEAILKSAETEWKAPEEAGKQGKAEKPLPPKQACEKPEGAPMKNAILARVEPDAGKTEETRQMSDPPSHDAEHGHTPEITGEAAAAFIKGREPGIGDVEPAKLIYASQYVAKYSQNAKTAKNVKESKLSIQERL